MCLVVCIFYRYSWVVDTVLEYLHAFFMIAGFMFMTSGFVTARFLKGRLWWLKIHKMLGIHGVFLIIAGFCLEIIHLSLIGAGHFNVPHANIGLIIVVMSVLLPLLGFMQFKFREYASKIRFFHRWSGRILLALMGINIVSGLYTAGII